MNKRLYRIVFNKARGLLMVVAEIVRAHGKGDSPASGVRATRQRGLCVQLAKLKLVSFATQVALGASLMVIPLAQAQIVADRSAPKNEQPTVLVTPNGVPNVNIQTPSAAGVSRNSYSRFDVQQQGAILNNARIPTPTQLGGWVAGNPWLATGTARVILNQVNSSDASLLRGYVEVGGDRAQVVIANPAGITCEGCGYINTSRATLTTGSPILNNGNLEGYLVQRGMVTVQGAGLDASRTDFTDIIARAVQVNAGIWAKELKVSAGANQVSADHAQTIPTTGTGPAPAFAIDVAQLGGMYAGKITLVGTEAGVGVRNAGWIGASAGEVIVTAEGWLENSGRLTSATHAWIDTNGGITNSGLVYALGDAKLATRGNIDNSGTIAAQGHATLTATGSASQISGAAGSLVGAGINAGGGLAASGNLDISATQSISTRGESHAAGDQSLSARALDLTDSQASARNLALTATTGNVDAVRASLVASETLKLRAAQSLRTDEARVFAAVADLSAQDLSNVKGQITVGQSLQLTLVQALDNSAGRIEAAQDVTVVASGITNTEGVVSGAKVDLDSRSKPLGNTRGTITARGTLRVRSGALTNEAGLLQALDSASINTQGETLANTNSGSTGGILSQSTLTLDTGELNNQAGFIGAKGNLTLNSAAISNTQGGQVQALGDLSVQTTSGTVNNSAGRIETAQNLVVAGTGITNTEGVVSGRNVDLDSRSQPFGNTRGTIAAQGTLQVQSGALTNDAGLLQAGDGVSINTHGETLANTNSGSTGGILSQSTLTLDTGDLNNQAGFIGAKGNLTVTSAAISNRQGGAFSSEQAITLTGSGLDNRGGQVQALGDISVQTGTVNNTASLIRSGKTLTVAANSVINADTRGTNQGIEGWSVHLLADHVDNSSGAVRADEALTLTGRGGLYNSQGLISSGKSLATKTGTVANRGGTLIAGGDLSVDSATLDGKVLSQGDLSVKLTGNYTHTGEFATGGTTTLETTGTVTNQSLLRADIYVTVKAAALDNQANAEISASNVQLTATDSVTNRGLIDAQKTFIETNALKNLGTGRIYGDDLAIAASTLTNEAENGAAPVIAARNRLDIGAQVITNREHALIMSAGDMAIGGGLDANRQATGQAATLNNNSATIEAMGSVDISAQRINNTNEHFSTQLVEVSRQGTQEYQLSGSPNRYRPDQVSVANHEVDYLYTPEGARDNWNRYDFTRTITETRIAASDPGQIVSGAAMRLSADSVLNDKSRIVAGGTLTGSIGTLTNTEVAGERRIADSGSATNFFRIQRKGRDRQGASAAGYNPPATIQAISLRPTVYEQNTAPTGSGTQIAAFTSRTVSETASGANAASVNLQDGRAVEAITQVAAIKEPIASGTQIAAFTDRTVSETASGANAARTVNAMAPVDAISPSPGAPTILIRTGGVNTNLPNNSLFRTNPDPAARYLVETDARFTSYRNWLSSDYLLQQLSFDAAQTAKRLGDGWYEQKLMREQVAQLTGRRFLDGYANDEAQYQALLNNGATFARQWNLRPGQALSAAQMAQLTSDIVWLVEKDVTLANGQVTKALVPQLYVRVKEGDLDGSGALIAGKAVNLNLSGDLTNAGTIAGRSVMALTAENVNNLGGRISGEDTALRARNDLHNVGGTLEATRSLTVTAERDLNVASTLRDNQNAQGSRTNLSRLAGLYVSGAGGSLVAMARRDANLTAAQVINAGGEGSTTLAAGRDLNFGTLTESSQQSIVWNSKNYRHDASRTDVGTTIQAAGDIRLAAGNDLNATAATVRSEQGAVVATAKRDVNLGSGISFRSVDEAHQVKGRNSWFSSKTITTRETLAETQAVGSTLSGDTITVQSGADLKLRGSNVVGTRDVDLAAQGNVAIEAAENVTASSRFRKEKTSGLFSSGGLGVTFGTQSQSRSVEDIRTTAAASTVGSTEGNVAIDAGEAYRQVASDVLAPRGDIGIAAKTVDIVEAQNPATTTHKTEFKQSGLTLTLTNPVLTAIQTGLEMYEASGQTKDSRLQALAAATTVLAAKNAYDSVAQDPENAGGIKLSISVGLSEARSTTVQKSSNAAGSTVSAGGDVSVAAKGAGADSDITVRGSTIKAGNNISLQAESDLNLLAAQNTTELRGTSSSFSASLGIGFALGDQNGVTIDVAAAGSLGKANGEDVAWTNTRIEAGNKLTLDSSADTTLKGAIASGKQIAADVGGNLNIESLQDSSRYTSKDTSAGVSVSICVPPICYGSSKAEVNFAHLNLRGNFESVIEQSGIKAGDDGFQVTVKGNTDLKGAVIASTDKATAEGKNSLTTGTLTQSDIRNKAEYSAQSVSVGIGYGGNGLSASAMAMNASDRDRSTTQSGISGGQVSITDEAKQQALTGKSAAATVASINRDVATNRDTSNALGPIFNEQEIRTGFAITGAFAREAGTFLVNRAKEADAKKAEADKAEKKAKDPNSGLSDEQRQALRDQAIQLRTEAQAITERWGPGGVYRQITTALVAAASGNVSAASSEFARNMVVNYVQQQGAAYIGKLVTEGTLEEGSAAHVALHAIVGCAGAAASSQSCASGAAGAAAGSLLTRLFSDTSPNETNGERETKRNLIAIIVTGIASTQNTGASTATNAAIAAVDNNWLATQQIVQMKKELAQAKTLLAQSMVAGKWALISGKQDVLTSSGVGMGLAEAGWNDVKGLAEFLSDPVTGLNGLKDIITSPDARQKMGAAMLADFEAKISRMQDALEHGGDQAAWQFGKDLGEVIWQVGSVVTGVGGVAKGGVALAKAGIKVGTRGLEALSGLAKFDSLVAKGGLLAADGRPLMDFRTLTSAQKSVVGEFFGSKTLEKLLPDARNIGRSPDIGQQGIDALYQVKRADVDYVVVEYKFDTSKLKLTDDGLQMSDEWLRGANTGYDRLAEAVGNNPIEVQKLDAALRSGRIEKWLVHTDPFGNVTIGVLGKDGKLLVQQNSKLIGVGP